MSIMCVHVNVVCKDECSTVDRRLFFSRPIVHMMASAYHCPLLDRVRTRDTQVKDNKYHSMARFH